MYKVLPYNTGESETAYNFIEYSDELDYSKIKLVDLAKYILKPLTQFMNCKTEFDLTCNEFEQEASELVRIRLEPSETLKLVHINDIE